MPGFKFIIDLYKPTTKTTRGEAFWFVRVSNAVDVVLIAPDSHVGHAGQYRPNDIFIRIEHHRLVCRTYFANIVTGNGISVFRVGNVEEALISDKWFGEVGFIVIKRQGKMPGMVDERPGTDILVGQREHGAGSEGISGSRPEGISPNSSPLLRSISQTLTKCIGSTKISNPNSPV